jgi:hypothetical protein
MADEVKSAPETKEPREERRAWVAPSMEQLDLRETMGGTHGGSLDVASS